MVSMGSTWAVPLISVTVSGLRAGIIKNCFVDTGASISLVKEDLVGPLLTNLKTTDKPNLMTASEQRIENLGLFLSLSGTVSLRSI